MASALKLYEHGGVFTCWDPLAKKTVYLGTDRAEAVRKQAEILSRAGRGTSGTTTTLPGEGPKVTTPAPAATGDLLDTWLASSPAPGPAPITPPPNPTPTPAPAALPTPVAAPKKKGGITPEQAAKIGGGLKRIATKANVVLDGALVSLFGRKPAMPEDDELEMLALGWEMMIEEFFVKNTPKPWMLVAAGNVLVVSAMYLQGTPIPRKTKAEREAEKNAQQAGAMAT